MTTKLVPLTAAARIRAHAKQHPDHDIRALAKAFGVRTEQVVKALQAKPMGRPRLTREDEIKKVIARLLDAVAELQTYATKDAPLAMRIADILLTQHDACAALHDRARASKRP